jgi:hypothetical protein
MASLPGGQVRIEAPARRAGDHDVTVRLIGRDSTSAPATYRGGAFSAVLPVPAPGPGGELRLIVQGAGPGGSTGGASRTLYRAESQGGAQVLRSAEAEWRLPAGGSFESVTILWELERSSSADELRPAGAGVVLHPAMMPLANPATLRLHADGGPAGRVHLYRYGSDGWEFIRSTVDSEGWVSGESRRLGRFQLFADTTAPHVTKGPEVFAPPPGPYPRWAVEAAVADPGSGIDARGSYFVIDGARVATEWDPEADRLRWRPLQRPTPGSHTVEIVIADRAGNVRRQTASFTVR